MSLGEAKKKTSDHDAYSRTSKNDNLSSLHMQNQFSCGKSLSCSPCTHTRARTTYTHTTNSRANGKIVGVLDQQHIGGCDVYKWACRPCDECHRAGADDEREHYSLHGKTHRASTEKHPAKHKPYMNFNILATVIRPKIDMYVFRLANKSVIANRTGILVFAVSVCCNRRPVLRKYWGWVKSIQPVEHIWQGFHWTPIFGRGQRIRKPLKKKIVIQSNFVTHFI